MNKGKNNKLPEDYGTPFTPSESRQDRRLPKDHPATDTDIDTQELYDAGVAAAAEINVPERSAVRGYHPKNNKKKIRTDK